MMHCALALRRLSWCARTKDPKKISMEDGRRTDIRPRQLRRSAWLEFSIHVEFPPKISKDPRSFRLCIPPPPHGRTKASTPNIHPTSQQSHIVGIGIGIGRRRHHDHGDNASDGCKGICTSILYETMDK